MTNLSDVGINTPDPQFMADDVAERFDRELIRLTACNSALYAALCRQIRRDLIRLFGSEALDERRGGEEWDTLRIDLTMLAVMNGDPGASARMLSDNVEHREREGEPEDRRFLYRRIRQSLTMVESMANMSGDDLDDGHGGLRPMPAPADAVAVAMACAVLRNDMTAARALTDRLTETATD